jgi:diacylglycerol kinase family enzyme
MRDAEVVAVVHPGKSGGLEAARERLAGWAHEHGWSAPHVVPTTAESPGSRQARDAVQAGADLVLGWGGDGTVRSVAEGLAGTGVPLGLLPGGTGNLLARNLGLPLDLEQAAEVAFTGSERAIDVLEIGLGGRVETSLVMAGIGLDAAIVDAPEQLKSALGPGAYVLNAPRALTHERMRVAVSVDGGPPRWMRARSVLVANVGGLIGPLDLAPESDASDGLLHVVVLPLGTPRDWALAAVRLVARRPRTDDSRVHLTGRSAFVLTTWDQPRQVDGDVVAEGRRLEARVRPGALRVRISGS